MNFKNISIGELIKKKVLELAIQMTRICNFFNCTEKEINDMFNADSIDTELLLKWSKLLEYDFFRLYTQHLILYAPPNNNKKNKITTSLPQFRKNIYTKDIIDFILEQI
ncbi:transposase, partial [Chryseobacterium sp.]|uniref:transposase n=2 Tax=unclassified Chryseobacterium TaxID=2593645 RepID=UPI0023F51CE1